MKTYNEIHKMISDLLDYHTEINQTATEQHKEELACCIDALLWVVDDDCGDFITVEHWKKKALQ